MPLKLFPPRPGKTPNWTIRGNYMRIAVDRSSGTGRRAAAQRELERIEKAIERGEYPPKPFVNVEQPTFISAAVAYLKTGGSRRGLKKLIEHFGETPLS